MIPTVPSIENLTLSLTQEIHVRAPLDATFDALLEQLGPKNDTPEGQAMPMKIEPWPGGEGGTATWVMAMGISGDMCKPSNGRRYSNSPDRYSCLIRLSRMCSTG
jgi:hypothetical protein